MPSIMSHYLLAKRVEAYIKEAYPDKAFSDKALLWGAQGPDFLFSYQSKTDENLMKTFGKQIHGQGADQTITFICNFAKGSKSAVDAGYALGFLSHFAFDSVAHPFVLYAAQEMAKDRDIDVHICHNLIETNVDIILLRYETGMVTNQLSLKTCAPKEDTVNQHMATLYYLLGKAVFEQEYDMDQIYKAAKDYQKTLRRLNDYTGFKKDYLLRKERKKNLPPTKSVRYRGLTEDDDYDYANIGNSSWTFGNTVYTDDFMSLMEKAYAYAVSLADAFFADADITGLTKNKTFLG